MGCTYNEICSSGDWVPRSVWEHLGAPPLRTFIKFMYRNLPVYNVKCQFCLIQSHLCGYAVLHVDSIGINGPTVQLNALSVVHSDQTTLSAAAHQTSCCMYVRHSQSPTEHLAKSCYFIIVILSALFTTHY